MTKYIALFLLFGSISFPSESFKIGNLTCEYQENPLGIETAHPRLSWQIKSSERGILQSAFQILAASDPNLLQPQVADLWDTGKVSSNRSAHVAFEGAPLPSRKIVYWKVRIWDQNDVAGEWSDIAHWEMTLSEEDWKAKWIGSPEESDSADSAPLFRKEFFCKAQPVRARAYVTGLGYYECYVNGDKLSDAVLAPAQTNYDQRRHEVWAESRVGNMATRVLYNIFYVTEQIRSGQNAVGIILGSGWYRQNDRLDEACLWYDTPRCLLQIEIEYKDGTRQLIISDENWKTFPSPIVHNGLHTGEIYDARLEQPGWANAEFDDSIWNDAVQVRAPQGALFSQISPLDRIVKELPPVSVICLDDSTYRYDFGQMFSGWIRLQASAERGEIVRLKYIEELGPTYGQRDTYIFRGEGREVWEPRFTWHAFRYVDVISPISLTKENLIGCVVNTDVDTTGHFSCSNSLFNRIQQNFEWTQLGNMHGGIPSDCPHRERRGYTGDGQIAARAAMYNFDMAAFYTKWLDDIFDAQNSRTGYVPNTAPYQDGGGGTAWGSAAVIIPWDMYLFYGDKKILKTYYPYMKKWLNYLTDALDERGVLVNQGLGEWVPPQLLTLPADFVNTCYYYLNCELLSKIAGILGCEQDSLNFKMAAQRCAEAINNIYYNAEGGYYATGRQGADVLPLAFGIVQDENIPMVLEHLKNHILSECRGHFDTGILGTPLLLQVLTTYDMVDLAYTLMNQRSYPSFGYMIEKGATTIWETWQGDQSHSHPMYGSVCAWFYDTIAGIRPLQTETGFKKTIICPYPVRGLDYAQATLTTLYGALKSEWKIQNESFYLNVSIPANCTALVLLPAVDAKHVAESGGSLDQANNVRLAGMQGSRAVLEIGSGDYSFVSQNCASLFPAPVPEAPTITPPDTLAFLPDSVLVKISHPQKQAVIRYTLDGKEPSAASAKFTGAFNVGEATIIKAKAWVQNENPGLTQERNIQFIDPEKNGISVALYDGAWIRLPDFSNLVPAKVSKSFRLNFDDLNLSKDVFGLVYTGALDITKPGDYTFYVQSNDGSRLWLGSECVVDFD